MIQITDDGTDCAKTIIHVKKIADRLPKDAFVYWFIQDILIENFAYDKKLHEEFCHRLRFNRIASPAEIYERIKTNIEIY